MIVFFPLGCVCVCLCTCVCMCMHACLRVCECTCVCVLCARVWLHAQARVCLLAGGVYLFVLAVHILMYVSPPASFLCMCPCGPEGALQSSASVEAMELHPALLPSRTVEKTRSVMWLLHISLIGCNWPPHSTGPYSIWSERHLVQTGMRGVAGQGGAGLAVSGIPAATAEWKAFFE